MQNKKNDELRIRDRVFVKFYRFWSFAKAKSKTFGKNISKYLSGKYSQKPPHHGKHSATDAFKTTLKRVI